jgi:mannose-6-phosphate isomerase-like protein (cupin superfamily)
MGQVVEFTKLNYEAVGVAAKRGTFTSSETTQMMCDIYHLEPGGHFEGQVPVGSDQYFYSFSGAVEISSLGNSQAMPQDTFSAVQEGNSYTITNTSSHGAEVISVLAPPPSSPDSGKLPGFSDGLKVSKRATQPVLEVPEQKKKRIYFAGKESAKTERAHAMIVVYERETVTGMHMHPNAESMFIMLSGKNKFTVNGQDVVIGRGQATIFPMTDRHGLCVADSNGNESVSFLEFHLPGAFTTVRG